MHPPRVAFKRIFTLCGLRTMPISCQRLRPNSSLLPSSTTVSVFPSANCISSGIDSAREGPRFTLADTRHGPTAGSDHSMAASRWSGMRNARPNPISPENVRP